MPKKPLIELYIEKKAEKNEIIDYDVISSNFVKCQFCKKLYHQQGVFKHEIYCNLNPNKKKTYSNKRLWHCNFCELLFKYNKERDLHQKRCSENPEVIIIHSRMSNKDKMALFKKEYPEIYRLLTIVQIKKFLGNGSIK